MSILSPELQAILARLPPHAERPAPPAANDLGGWQALQADIERRAAPACDRAVSETGVRISTARYAELDALLITPPNARTVDPAIFIHGGAYTSFSARSSVFASAPLATALARPVIALDYPLAPHANFRITVPSVAAALAAISMKHANVAVIGDSAGGGLALAALHKLDCSVASMPVGLALISPWTNLTNSGESHRTCAASDPILAYEPGLRIAAAAYAGDEPTHPDASPGLAHYSEDFPPCLIICGSNEILLSDALRLHETIGERGAELCVWPGLFHSFPTIAPQAPESQQALLRIRDFIDAKSGV